MSPETLDQCMTAASQDDDQEAFARVVEACHHLVRATVLREAADAELADEIAQEVFVRGWCKRNQYRPGTNPRAWLLAITRSQLMEHHRRQSRERRHFQSLIRRELLRRAAERQPAREDLASRRAEALHRCLSGLDESQRHLIDLIHGQGLSTADAAAAIGIHPPTCRKRLSRLQQSLRRCAEEQLQETA